MESDEVFVHRLRAGDEAAFRDLVRRHHGAMISVALGFVRNRATAEEVVQETWRAVVAGLEGLSAPGALTGWIYTILANIARRRARREQRQPLLDDLAADDGPAVDPERFTRRGFWREDVAAWDPLDPERILAGRELWRHLRAAVETLPPGQRAVVLLRDVEGLEPADVCRILGISDANRRVLLHRARARLRQVLEELPGEAG